MSDKKQFDAVELMRCLRDRVATVIESLSPEEQLARLDRPLSDPALEKLRRRAAQPGAAAAAPQADRG